MHVTSSMINSVARGAASGAVLGFLFTLVLLLGHQVRADHVAGRPDAVVAGPIILQPNGDDQWV